MRAAVWARVAGVGAVLTLAPAATAQLVQPQAPADGAAPVVVPRPVSANEIADATGLVPEVPNAGQYTSLQQLFMFRGETLDFQQDAKTEPSTFSPLCSFSGTLVLRGGGCEVAFGWYNAVQSGGAPPPAGELYPLIEANDATVYGEGPFTPLATNGPWMLRTFTASDIRNDARYAGGEIGFVMIGSGACSQNKYSQRHLNQDCSTCTPVEPFITTVVYPSTVTPNAYYLAFEDLPVSPTSFTQNNDGDFNDFVFFITGVVCSGGGQACDTGLQGACAVGKTDCTENGMPGQCRQTVKPTDEACDNVDNDCNGTVDDGDLCPAGKVCDLGSCVAACGTGEFRCPQDLECDRGFCIDPRCVDITCEAGKACRAGQCVGACDGVTCPLGEECQLGRCVDLCAGVTCQEKQVCEKGLCVAECGCRDCGAGRECSSASGQCVDRGCDQVTCAANQACVAGACQDKCAGAVCPGGAACVDGKCSAVPMNNEGGSAGSGGTNVIPIEPLPTAGALNSPGAGGASASGGSKNGNGVVLKSGETATGCSCRAVGEGSRTRFGWLALIGLGMLRLRRRRA